MYICLCFCKVLDESYEILRQIEEKKFIPPTDI